MSVALLVVLLHTAEVLLGVVCPMVFLLRRFEVGVFNFFFKFGIFNFSENLEFSIYTYKKCCWSMRQIFSTSGSVFFVTSNLQI